MRIGLDIMGGDFAPSATVQGAVLAKAELPASTELVLIGDENLIFGQLEESNASASDFTIIHADQKIEMGDHPVRAISMKPRSSMAYGFNKLANGELDAFCSAGNTGAMLAGTMFTLKTIPGIIRPAIAVALPRKSGGNTLLLDVGLNPDVRQDVLYQFGIMGSLYSHHVYGVENPGVGLLNIGSEEDKGSILSKAAYQLMKGNPDFNFVGNVEGNELFFDKADVVVCDGFAGNVVLKQAESFYYLMKGLKCSDPFLERFNYENFGGTPILGIGSPVLIGHGISSPLAIKNMLVQNKTILESGLITKLIKAFK
ncbi:MAG: phosphate acyltransferase PlsX [Bacteroidetes bacterium]|jgi:phosphate acyltransferase|nr:phosphate acyltransferase PlsX [Bacteroidota bacterium]MBT3747536.1 phosphate acyltransferase PlsX [Bacteroidota bacterium]MBT4398177.1 phosphate acyltransferase PlsX [Bacteroidota bacterium]MBT4409464.1 phosphate acyltransferase PlsX [Bacteroidota bacterium]MBT7462594.1 phosphate acyltransferase PlsX [Bacteroidota bacterium]